MAKKPGIRRIAVMVNRVDTARVVAEELGISNGVDQRQKVLEVDRLN